MFREHIRKHYDHLSRSYRNVADFILKDYRSAAFMTAAALADAVHVDTTTVVRFAQRLGYPGFPELVEDIQEQVKLELNQTYATPSAEEGLHAKVQVLMTKDRANLEKCLAHNTANALEDVFDLLRAAPSVIVLGESYAAPLAASFAGMLREAGLPAVYVSGDVYERATALAHIVRKTLVIGMTPVEGPSGIAKVLRFARKQGATTLACAPSLSSQAARAAEHLLYAPGELEGSPLPSLTVLYALCTAVAQTVSSLQPEARVEQAAEVAHALEALA